MLNKKWFGKKGCHGFSFFADKYLLYFVCCLASVVLIFLLLFVKSGKWALDDKDYSLLLEMQSIIIQPGYKINWK